MRYLIVNLQDFFEVDFDKAFDVVAKHAACYVGAKAIWYAFTKSESFFNYHELLLKGCLTKAEFIEKNRSLISSFQMSEKQFISAWNCALSFSPICKELFTLLKQINKNPDLKLILIADINPIHFAFMKAKLQLNDLLGECYFSYNFGVVGNALLAYALSDLKQKSSKAEIAIAFKKMEYPGYASWLFNPKKNWQYRENEAKHKILQKLADEHNAKLESWPVDPATLKKSDFFDILQKWLVPSPASVHSATNDLPDKVNDLTFVLDKLRVTPDSPLSIQASNSSKKSEKIKQKTQINSR